MGSCGPASPLPESGAISAGAEYDLIMCSSQHQLEEKIERLKYTLTPFRCNVSGLPDKGEKLRLQLRLYQEELDRRRRPPPPPSPSTQEPPAVVDKNSEKSDGLDQSKCDKSSGSIEEQKSKQTDSPSSFAKLFCKRLETSTGSSKCGEEKRIACKEISKNQNVQIGTSCTDVPFKSIISISDVDKTVPPKNVNCTGSSSKNNLTSVSAKRKRVSEIGSSKSKKYKEVVLLDEESQPSKENEIKCKDSEEARICYPSSDHPDFAQLSCSDLKCLEPEEYLSSPVMNFYILYLQRSLSPDGAPRSNCYFFNTYFYNKLEGAVSTKGKKDEAFLKLRRWFKGVNIFEKAYIFMPVYGNMHWSLAIICIPPNDDNSGPMVLHLDSLGYHRSVDIFDAITKFLKEEWACIDRDTPQNKLPLPIKKWKNLPRRIQSKILKVPQQENEFDCGLFVLYFMKKFFEKAPERLRKKDLSMLGIKWFERFDASAMRERIKALLLEAFDNYNSEKCNK